jgi:hypothetical protein
MPSALEEPTRYGFTCPVLFCPLQSKMLGVLRPVEARPAKATMGQLRQPISATLSARSHQA